MGMGFHISDLKILNSRICSDLRLESGESFTNYDGPKKRSAFIQ